MPVRLLRLEGLKERTLHRLDPRQGGLGSTSLLPATPIRGRKLMIRRIVLLGSVSALLAAFAGAPASADPEPDAMLAEYNSALASSEADNQAFDSTNVDFVGNVTCAITPYDAINGTYRSAGFGSPQGIVENVTVKAEDHAAFQASCHSPDADAFTLNLEYYFGYQVSSGVWAQASYPAFTCSTLSTGVGRVRVASLEVPGSLNCPFKQFYPENDQSLGKSHRLYVKLTTTAGNQLEGVSKPWALLCLSGPCGVVPPI